MIIIMGFRGKTISASKSTPYLTKKCVKLAWRFCLKGALDEGNYVWTGLVNLSWEYNCTTTLTQYTMCFFLGSKLSELIPSIFYLASHWKKKHKFALFILYNISIHHHYHEALSIPSVIAYRFIIQFYHGCNIHQFISTMLCTLIL